MKKSNLFIRNVDDETKRRFMEWADGRGLNAAGALAVLVNTTLTSSDEKILVLSDPKIKDFYSPRFRPGNPSEPLSEYKDTNEDSGTKSTD